MVCMVLWVYWVFLPSPIGGSSCIAIKAKAALSLVATTQESVRLSYNIVWLSSMFILDVVGYNKKFNYWLFSTIRRKLQEVEEAQKAKT